MYQEAEYPPVTMASWRLKKSTTSCPSGMLLRGMVEIIGIAVVYYFVFKKGNFKPHVLYQQIM